MQREERASSLQKCKISDDRLNPIFCHISFISKLVLSGLKPMYYILYCITKSSLNAVRQYFSMEVCSTIFY